MSNFIINALYGTIKLITGPIKSILYIAALIVFFIIIYFRIKFYANAVSFIDVILVFGVPILLFLNGKNKGE